MHHTAIENGHFEPGLYSAIFILVGMSYWWCLELYDQICYCVGENILAYTWPSNDKCLAVKGIVF